MRWTWEKPKQDGWYWYRRGAITMVFVFAGSRPFALECGMADRTLLEYMDGEWCGPVEPPRADK